MIDVSRCMAVDDWKKSCGRKERRKTGIRKSDLLAATWRMLTVSWEKFISTDWGCSGLQDQNMYSSCFLLERERERERELRTQNSVTQGLRF